MWLTTIALFAVWLWLRKWGRTHAKGQLHRSMEAAEDENAGITSSGSDPDLEPKVVADTTPPSLSYGANGSHPSPSSTPATN